MTKQLKPGQVYTIDKHVYRCKKAITYNTCVECVRKNKINCLLLHNHVIPANQTCYKLFGLQNYPVLVK